MPESLNISSDPQQNSDGSPTCKAASSGYVCVREENHGALHYDEEFDSWWIYYAHGADEEYGIKPMTGYQLLSDTLLTKDKI